MIETINCLQAEKEALIAGQETMSKYIEEQRAEIERLQNKVEELSDVLSDTIRIRYAEAKAEAIKEFAKKIRQKISAMVCSPDLLTLDDYDKCIDDVLKEMVGEKNEIQKETCCN